MNLTRIKDRARGEMTLPPEMEPVPEGVSRRPIYGDIQAVTEAVREAGAFVIPLKREVGRIIVGQDHLVERLLVALLADGHVLLEGLPGLAKTLTLKTLAAAIDTGFGRIQFTPDMLPADIVGTEVFSPGDVSFVVKKGPVFTNLILADEINRAPAKVQSALLEAMEERQVTIGDCTYALPEPFLVLATQNPIEHEGTYPLPEAQMDRFMMKVVITYPTPAEERAILDAVDPGVSRRTVNPAAREEEILAARKVVRAVYMDDRVKDYIVTLVHATREPGDVGLDLAPYIQTGASPRATVNLKAAAKALAFLRGRGYATPEDVKSAALDVLRHRVAVTYEAEAEGIASEDIVNKILETVPVP